MPRRSRHARPAVSCIISLILLSATSPCHTATSATVGALTIDDASGAAILYTSPTTLSSAPPDAKDPNSFYWTNQNCSSCSGKPALGSLQNGTYTAVYLHPKNPYTYNITFQFTGIAIEIYLVLSKRAPTSCSFILDGNSTSWSGSTEDEFQYNVLAFSMGTLEEQTHELTISAAGMTDKPNYLNFDYAQFTPPHSIENVFFKRQDDTDTFPPPSATTPPPPLPTTTPPPTLPTTTPPPPLPTTTLIIPPPQPTTTSLSPPPTTPSPSPLLSTTSTSSTTSSAPSPSTTSNSHTTIKAIAGGVIGGFLAVLTLILFASFYRHRRLRDLENVADPFAPRPNTNVSISRASNEDEDLIPLVPSQSHRNSHHYSPTQLHTSSSQTHLSPSTPRGVVPFPLSTPSRHQPHTNPEQREWLRQQRQQELNHRIEDVNSEIRLLKRAYVQDQQRLQNQLQRAQNDAHNPYNGRNFGPHSHPDSQIEMAAFRVVPGGMPDPLTGHNPGGALSPDMRIPGQPMVTPELLQDMRNQMQIMTEQIQYLRAQQNSPYTQALTDEPPPRYAELVNPYHGRRDG